MGWNQVAFKKRSKLTRGIKDDSYFYFVHSYYAEPKNSKNVLGITNYGNRFASILEQEPIFAVQFHPEKSQKDGLQILKNFIEY